MTRTAVNYSSPPLRQLQADLKGKISALETHTAHQHIDTGLIRHDLRSCETKLRLQESQPVLCLPNEGLHPDIHKPSLSPSMRVATPPRRDGLLI